MNKVMQRKAASVCEFWGKILSAGGKLLATIGILALVLISPLQKSPAAETGSVQVSAKYTYWIEMTSWSAEGDGGTLPSGRIAPATDRPRRIYLPFFAIDKGKAAIPLKVWERGLDQNNLSFPDKLYSDRELSVEDGGVDLIHGFQKTGSKNPADGADHFRHTVYGQSPSAGLLKAEFKVTREPSRFGTPTEADLALFDRTLIDLYVQESDDSTGPLAFIATLGQRAISLAVDLFFIVDGLFTKSKSAVTPDYLERIAQPSSAFYKDYLEYQSGGLTENQLIQRLPHVAMIGDSLVKNAYVASIPTMFWRVRTEHQSNWFLDTDRSPESVHSIYERLEKFTPLVAAEYSGAGANVDSGNTGETFFQMLSKTRNFSQQVDEILENERFPDLTLIWIGHNNINWAAPLDSEGRKNPDMPLLRRLWRFRKYYARQLERLVDGAKQQNHKTAIVVFGVVNFEAFFKARRAAGLLKEKDPELYPHFETGYRIYISMRPEYQNNMIRLALLMNAELRNLVERMNRELKGYPNVRLEYSDALATADLNHVELVHPVDAWHPSAAGHNRLAEAAFGALPESLRFLGIFPK